jgi:hypothetical protein
MSSKGGKAAQKSDDITGMPRRNRMTEVTPNVKQTSKREQDIAKKSKKDEKNGLLKYFGNRVRIPAPTSKETPIDAVMQRRESRDKGNNTSNGAGDRVGEKNKFALRKSGKSMPSKASKPEDEANMITDIRKGGTPKTVENEREHTVYLEAMSKTPLKEKGKKGEAKQKKKNETSEKEDDRTKAKKKATFAEMVEKDANQIQCIEYTKCVVGFAIRVDKGNNTKGGFDKKLMEGLGFMQTYINKHASFHPIGKDQTVKPIREKTDMPKYQVTTKNYFSIPNQRAFNNVRQDGGRVFKGSAVMGFSTDPQTCLDDASGDLRMMGCAIYYKKCHKVNTVATLMLAGAPSTIEEYIIKRTTDKELMVLEKKLLLTNMDYKLTKSQSKKWISYAVVEEFPAGMPWEGAEERKQKQGTSNARLAYVFHKHQPDHKRMKRLLAYAKLMDIWRKHWGNTAFTIEIPDERSAQGVKTKYIQMVQTHGLVQLSIGAALIDGMFDIDTPFMLHLLPGVDGKPRPPTTSSVREVFRLMEINKKKGVDMLINRIKRNVHRQLLERS